MDRDALAPPHHHPQRAVLSSSFSSPLDEGYCSSASDSIADLSTRFDRHSLRPSPPPRPHSPPALHSVRHQRQLATRRQCSTENLTRISHLVERMLHDRSGSEAPRSAARIAHQSAYFPDPASSSPRSPTSSLDDSESDYSLAAGSRERVAPAAAARPWSAVEAARGRRKDAVEKTVRMRKRPGGRTTARRKD
ncbi:hypothetical protein MMC15_003310 [Xylographa vitiligo]|nr:hypothetical protein [Xylographa vitiligo]